MGNTNYASLGWLRVMATIYSREDATLRKNGEQQYQLDKA
jgi:hypothetical protein